MGKTEDVDRARHNVIRFNDGCKKQGRLTLGSLPPIVQILAENFGMDYIQDLRKAYLWVEEEMKLLQVKPDKMLTASFRWDFPRPDVTTVAFLDPVSGQLLIRSTNNISCFTCYYLPTNSNELLKNDGKELFRCLLGGLFVYDESVARKWEYILEDWN